MLQLPRRRIRNFPKLTTLRKKRMGKRKKTPIPKRTTKIRRRKRSEMRSQVRRKKMPRRSGKRPLMIMMCHRLLEMIFRSHMTGTKKRMPKTSRLIISTYTMIKSILHLKLRKRRK